MTGFDWEQLQTVNGVICWTKMSSWEKDLFFAALRVELGQCIWAQQQRLVFASIAVNILEGFCLTVPNCSFECQNCRKKTRTVL